MATLREYIYDIRMLAQRMRVSDDSRLTDRMITFWINNQRELWLKRQENKSYRRDSQVIQSLGAVPLEVVDVSEAPSNLKTGVSILRTKKKIPQTIVLDDLDDGITSVGPIDKLAHRFSYIDYTRVNFAGSCKYNRNEVFAFRQNNQDESYLYLFSNDDNQTLKTLEYVNVRGIFRNPLDLQNYKDYNGVSVFTKDSDYPMNSAIWEYMKDQILKSDIGFMSQVRTDTTNDANEITNE